MIALILLPLISSVILFLIKDKQKARTTSVILSFITLLIGIYALINYNKSFTVNYLSTIPWLQALGISFSFGLNGLSLVLVMLTVIIVPLILLTTGSSKPGYPSAFYALVLMMEAALIGVFSSMDGLLFYVFWELTLIPIYFICGLWGGENRVRITMKFFIYTMLGSLFMLIALIWLYLKTPYPHSFALSALIKVNNSYAEQIGIFTAFFLAFAIKTPLFPLHSWQPDTYTTAPSAGSMLLAGLMAKMGLYGFIRLLLPVCKPIVALFAPYFIPLTLIGLIYASVIAIQQNEIKRLIAYSSLAHVSLMACVLFTLNYDALQGSIYQMLSHGFNVVGLFFAANIIYDRTKTTTISDLGGIAKSAPYFAVFFMIVMLGSVALPLTNGFVGEFLMLLGLAQYSLVVSFVAGLTIILSAVYMFWMYQKTMYGEPNSLTLQFKDLTAKEMAVAIPITVFIIGMGIYPKPIFEIIKPAIEGILASI